MLSDEELADLKKKRSFVMGIICMFGIFSLAYVLTIALTPDFEQFLAENQIKTVKILLINLAILLMKINALIFLEFFVIRKT